MDEDEYRRIYRVAIPRRCVFEKAVLARHCDCSRARRRNLAEREAVACESARGRAQCEAWLAQLRARATFALQVREGDDALPHAKAIKLQAGGLQGLAGRVAEADERPWLDAGKVVDVVALLDAADKQFGGLEGLPFEEIVRAVARFSGRRRPHGRR